MTDDPGWEPTPHSDAAYAHYALCDPPPPMEDGHGWVLRTTIESSRGRPSGSDGVDYGTGLTELAEHGWAENDEESQRERWRLTHLGRTRCERRRDWTG